MKGEDNDLRNEEKMKDIVKRWKKNYEEKEEMKEEEDWEKVKKERKV